MPVYEFVCTECDHSFEELLFGDERARCPKCTSVKLEKKLSTFAVSGESASAPAFDGPGACGSCGDPRGPGACSRD